MKSIIKKITTTVLCGILATGSALSANAALNDEETHKDFEITDVTQKIGNNQIFVATTGYTDKTAKDYGIKFIATDNKEYNVFFKDCIDSPKIVNLPKGENFASYMVTGGHGWFGDSVANNNFDNAGGEYVKVRIKLSDFSNYFNENGTITSKLSDGSYRDFDYTYEDFGVGSDRVHKYASSCAYATSGAAITSFVPDKDGYVEIYISRHIGVKTCVMTYTYCILEGRVRCEEGKINLRLNGLSCGDTDLNGHISVADATLVQKHIANIDSLDELQLFNADVNHYGDISVVDATLIQKYVVGLYK